MRAAIQITLRKISDTDRASVILTGPGGEASHEFPLIWVDDESWQAVFWSLELYSQDSRTWPKKPAITSKAEKLGLFVNLCPSDERLRVIGAELYRMVFGSEKIRRLLSHLLLQEYDDVPVVQLHIPEEGSILQAYPWELLHDDHDFLFDSRRAFLVRYVDFDQPIPEVELTEALRVLSIDPRPDMSLYGYASLPLLDRPHLERLSNRYPGRFVVSDLGTASRSEATLSELHKQLMTFPDTHILHIDTHGDYGWLCRCKWLNLPGAKTCKRCAAARARDQKARGYLAFEADNRDPVWISGDDLAKQIQGRGVQVVVLSACKSGLVTGSSTFNSIAGALVKRGITAVVAMQFSVDGRAAEVFVDDFYRALMLGRPLTEAVAEARIGLLAVSNESWYRPVLYLRTDPTNYQGQIFTFTASEIERELFLEEIDRPSRVEMETGTMPPDSRYYIERQADKDCWGYLSQDQAVTIAIKASRQMGKSSLMLRMTHQAKQMRDVDTAVIDFQKFPEQLFEDEEAFLIELCFMIGDALHIPEAIDKYWGSRRRSNIIKCSNYVSQHVIPSFNRPFILAMDETERMLTSPFRNNFFGMLRTWHNDRAKDKNYAQMTLFLSSSTEPHLFIDNPHQSPFNVAIPILLQDFTMAEVEELNRRHGAPLSQAQVSDLMDLLGGHPFLTRLALYLLTTRKIEFNTVLATATSDTGPFGDHLRRYWQHILDMTEIKRALSQICRHQTHREDKLYYRLKGAGLIKAEGSQVVMRNKLYARYFEERLDG